MAIEKAESEGAKLIIANDPDADRFAAAEKLPRFDIHMRDSLWLINTIGIAENGRSLQAMS